MKLSLIKDIEAYDRDKWTYLEGNSECNNDHRSTYSDKDYYMLILLFFYALHRVV